MLPKLHRCDKTTNISSMRGPRMVLNERKEISTIYEQKPGKQCSYASAAKSFKSKTITIIEGSYSIT